MPKKATSFNLHGNVDFKKPREITQKTIAILTTIIMHIVDAMLHNTHTLPTREKFVGKMFTKAK